MCLGAPSAIHVGVSSCRRVRLAPGRFRSLPPDPAQDSRISNPPAERLHPDAIEVEEKGRRVAPGAVSPDEPHDLPEARPTPAASLAAGVLARAGQHAWDTPHLADVAHPYPQVPVHGPVEAHIDRAGQL